jgi:hypothetical protein
MVPFEDLEPANLNDRICAIGSSFFSPVIKTQLWIPCTMMQRRSTGGCADTVLLEVSDDLVAPSCTGTVSDWVHCGQTSVVSLHRRPRTPTGKQPWLSLITKVSGSPLSTLPTPPSLFRYCLLAPCSTNCPPPSILDAHFRAHPNSTSWSLSSTLYGSLDSTLL